MCSEILQHINFCQLKCQDFFGRNDTLKVRWVYTLQTRELGINKEIYLILLLLLQMIRDYVLGETPEPFVIYGDSGCGKTSLMAMAAKYMWQWEQDPVVILRSVNKNLIFNFQLEPFRNNSTSITLVSNIFFKFYIIQNICMLKSLKMNFLNER